MHKGCIFKFGCTFLVILIQVMCDQKFKICQNKPSDSTFPKKKVSKNDCTKQTNDKNTCLSCTQQTKTNVICNQPHTCNPDPCTCHFSSSNEHIKFDNKTSTLTFPPSFNLKSDKKSTPVRFSQNCNQSCFQISPSPLIKKKRNATKKQTQSETKIDIEVHRDNEASTDDETFHSM